MKHFVIYTNEHKDPELVMTARIQHYLIGKGQSAGVYLGGSKPAKGAWESLSFVGTDCLIVLGGDGTMLQAARDVMGDQVPLVGVNLGTLGYMTEVEPAHLEEALDRLIDGNYQVESRMMLHGRILPGAETTMEEWALNDIVISRSGPLQILKFNIYVNGMFLKDYHADGVIVTTPTGSTGYNLSAGGPIVEPKARLMMLTPICPHTLNQRSIILSPEDVVEIEISEGRDGQDQLVEASFDGGHAVTLHTGDWIRIAGADKTTRFIRLDQVSFLEVLHKKLSEG